MTKTAVLYLRVSTREQAERGGEAEGFSIPAQRAANLAKARSIDADVVAEFVDAGESARKADRPGLRKLLAFIATNRIDYCIVHKVDRLSRSRVDDVEITLELNRAGTQLVSATESIDETPSGVLLHGIMSTIAEFYSRNLATEVVKGMTQKAVAGGTPNRAPIGYSHVRSVDGAGREVRTIEVDDARADLIRWAFEQYATGSFSLSALAIELSERGLRTRATRRTAPRPVSVANLHKILRNPYYLGQVTWRGVSYDGRHEPLVDEATWGQVQTVLAAHNLAGDHQQKHDHYLRGSIFCGSCGSRLIVTKTRNRYGREYEYFICIGRHRRRTACARRAMPIADVETAVERAWDAITLSFRDRRQLEAEVTSRLEHLRLSQSDERPGLERRRDSLLAERRKLLAAHYADAVPLDLLRDEQARIAADLDTVMGRLAGLNNPIDELTDELDVVIKLLRHLGSLYRSSDDLGRRLLNQVFAHRIYLDDSDHARVASSAHLAAIEDPDRLPQAMSVRLHSPLRVLASSARSIGL